MYILVCRPETKLIMLLLLLVNLRFFEYVFGMYSMLFSCLSNRNDSLVTLFVFVLIIELYELRILMSLVFKYLSELFRKK